MAAVSLTRPSSTVQKCEQLTGLLRRYQLFSLGSTLIIYDLAGKGRLWFALRRSCRTISVAEAHLNVGRAFSFAYECDPPVSYVSVKQLDHHASTTHWYWHQYAFHSALRLLSSLQQRNPATVHRSIFVRIQDREMYPSKPQ